MNMLQCIKHLVYSLDNLYITQFTNVKTELRCVVVCRMRSHGQSLQVPSFMSHLSDWSWTLVKVQRSCWRVTVTR